MRPAARSWSTWATGDARSRRDGRPGGASRVRARQRVHHGAARAVRRGRRCPPADGRSRDLPGQRRFGGHRDGPQAGPCLSHRPRRAGPLDRLRPLGELPRQHPGALDLSGRKPLRRPYEGWLGRFRHVSAAYPYRGGDPGSNALATGDELAAELEAAFVAAGPGTVAAFVAEPIVGATLAAAVPPDDYWPKIAEVCRRHGVLLIADEVMTGFGRTGRWFGLDHWGVRPDLLVAAKGATSGYWPFGFVAASDEVHGRSRAGRASPTASRSRTGRSPPRSPTRSCASSRRRAWSRRVPRRENGSSRC